MKRDRFQLRVGHVDEGDPQLPLHAPQFAAHLQAQIFVERRQRFVQQQDARIGDQCARQGNALLLAARELRRQAVGERLQMHLLQQFARAGMSIGLRCAAHFERKRNIIQHATMRE